MTDTKNHSASGAASSLQGRQFAPHSFAELAEAIGVDIPQLPLVLSAAQWLEEQALADGCFGLALGLPLHLGLPPFVTGSKLVTKVLTEDMKSLTGGQVIINGDAKESADILDKIIEEKRAGLNI